MGTNILLNSLLLFLECYRDHLMAVILYVVLVNVVALTSVACAISMLAIKAISEDANGKKKGYPRSF